MNNFELYQARLVGSRGLNKQRLVDNKIETFKRALARSYNSVNVRRDGRKFPALITGIPTSPIITKKNFATLLDYDCEVGDTIYWEEHDSYWIITEHDSTEMAVFQGSIQQCLYVLEWRDPITGEIYKAHAAAKGPEETTITSGVKHSIFFDRLTDSLYLILPSKTRGIHLLQKYFQIMLAGRKWEIEIVDDVTRKELVYIDLKQIPMNKELDTDNLAKGKIPIEYEILSILDELQEVKLGDSIEIKPILLKNGELVRDPEFKIRSRGNVVEENSIHFTEEGETHVTIEFPKYAAKEKYSFKVVETPEEKESTKSIKGPREVKTFMDITLLFSNIKNGEVQISNGYWEVDQDKFTILEENNYAIQLKTKNKPGMTTVKYIEGDKVYEHEIMIRPLFGGIETWQV